MPNKSFNLKRAFFVFIIGFALHPLHLFAAPVEIPYVPFEVSSFPDSLKKFCNDERYGIQSICSSILKGEISDDNLKALRYIWYNEKKLLDASFDEVSKGVKETTTDCKNACHATKVKTPLTLEHIPTERFSSLEEKIINGLGEFVVTRAKAEAAFFFQEKLKKELCEKDENKDYFPNTCVTLDTLQLSMSLNSMGGYLRAAVKKDIENMPDMFLKGAIFMAVDNKANNIAETLTTTRLLIGAYNAAKDGMTPNDIFRGLSNIDEVLKCDDLSKNKCDANFSSDVIKKLKVISKLYKAYETNVYYYDNNHALQIRSAKEWPYVIVSLIFTYYKDYPSETEIKEKLNNLLKAGSIINQFKEIQDLIAVIKQPISSDNSKNYDPKQRLNERIQAMDKMLSLIVALHEQAKLSSIIPAANDNPEIDNIISNIHKHILIAKEILRGDEAGYMQAFLILASENSTQLPKFAKNEFQNQSIDRLRKKIMASLLFKISTTETDKVKWLNTLLENNDFCNSIRTTESCPTTAYELIKLNRQLIESKYQDLVPKLKDKSIIGDEIRRVIPVMVEIANAQSSKDVANVLEAAAAPVGSYREKAKREMFSITALFGASGGGNEYYTLNGESKTHTLVGFQAFAPVGLHYSWPFPFSPKRDYIRNLGLFLSLIDIGPIVSTENGSGVKSETSVGFRQLFAPGIYATVHIWGPINIGYGVSKTPDVMKSAAPGGETITDAWRHQGFIAMDLTLFPF